MLSKVKMMLGMLLVMASFGANAAAVDVSVGVGEIGRSFGALPVGDTDIFVQLEDNTTTSMWAFTFTPDVEDSEENPFFYPVPATFSASIFDSLNQLVGTVAPTSDSPVSLVLRNLVADTYRVVMNTDVDGGYTFAVSTVPVPAAALLFGSALLGFAGFSARRKVS
ncbi:hypothetical protein [Amphritea sp. HPY]|uniref:hypothetical protein n=1 Tax=Amphritea sp. HPY TaxID=3421652 RepID=UPI003D7C8675